MTLRVRVHAIDLDGATAGQARADSVLPPAERAGTPAARLARFALRSILGERLGIAPDRVAISRQCRRCGDPHHGRPELASDDALSFSMSHSGSVALVAVTAGVVPIGVDVEVVRARRDLDALAARVLAPDVYDRWRARPDAERLRGFLQEWTAKEAYLKATGVGIVTRLAAVDPRPPGWSNAEIEVPHAVAHVAARAHSLAIEHVRWN